MSFDLAALLGRAEGTARAAQRAGAEEAEAYLWSTREVEANVVGRIPSARASASTGLGLRAIVQGKRGHASCSSLAPAQVARAIHAALDDARGSAPTKEPEQLAEPQPGRGPASPWDPRIADAEPAEVVRDAAALATDMGSHPEVVFRSALLTHSAFAFAVASTRGVAAADQGTSSKLLTECRARRGTEERTGNVARLERHRIAPEGLGQETVDRALASMGARPVQAGRRDVLFDAAASAGVFQPTLTALSGQDALDSRSFLAGKVGQEVAAPCITLRDAPSRGGPRAAAFDDEGTPSRDKVVVERGVLRGFLHDARSGRRTGAASTGNALRVQEDRVRAPPAIAPMNLAPDPGGEAFDDLVAELDRGVVVRHHLMGVFHANPVSGDFSLAAPNAFWVERGCVAHALPPVTIAGNALDALRSAQAVSREALGATFGTLPGLWVRGLACAT